MPRPDLGRRDLGLGRRDPGLDGSPAAPPPLPPPPRVRPSNPPVPDRLGPHRSDRDEGRARDADADSRDDRRAQPARGRDPHDDRPMPIDQQIDAMTGEALAARLRRAPVQRRRNPPGSQVAADPVIPLALSDFHDLRRLGLFGDDGRNPPPSWWAR